MFRVMMNLFKSNKVEHEMPEYYFEDEELEDGEELEEFEELEEYDEDIENRYYLY